MGFPTLIDDRGIEPRSTAVSERRLTSRPVVASQHVSFRAVAAAKPTPSGICPPQAGIRAARFRSAESRSRTRNSLAGRIRTSVHHPRKVALGSAELRRGALSAGVEPASPGRQPSRATRRVRERGWSPGESNPAGVGASHLPDHQEPHESDRRDSNPVCGAGNAVCFRPDTTVASRSAPSGVRTRVTGVRDRHPGRLDDRGVGGDSASTRPRGLEPRHSGFGDPVVPLTVGRTCQWRLAWQFAQSTMHLSISAAMRFLLHPELAAAAIVNSLTDGSTWWKTRHPG